MVKQFTFSLYSKQYASRLVLKERDILIISMKWGFENININNVL